MNSQAPTDRPAAEVVLVHGLWFGAWAMRVLATRLRHRDMHPQWFNYSTTREPPARSAARLHRWCERSQAEELHLLGHSLGGLLILQMLQHSGWDRPGRVLFLGTPLKGSAVARRTAGWPGAGLMFGEARNLLLAGAPFWPQGRACGMIAGTRPLGLGRLPGGLEQPNDGTVSLAETHHPGLAARLDLPVTHTGMLYSRRVARQAAAFLATGRFEGA